jgi:hypothetical protein
VTAVTRFVDEGVAKNVATLAPSPETPVEIGNPVAFVRVPLVGVPRIGVTKVGEVAKTSAPVPVSLVTIAAISAEVSISVLESAPPAAVPSPSLSHVDPFHRQIVVATPAALSHAPTAESSVTMTTSPVAGEDGNAVTFVREPPLPPPISAAQADVLSSKARISCMIIVIPPCRIP